MFFVRKGSREQRRSPGKDGKLASLLYQSVRTGVGGWGGGEEGVQGIQQSGREYKTFSAQAMWLSG